MNSAITKRSMLIKSGFTLLELLMIVSIIGILSSTVFTATADTYHRAKGTNATLTLRAVESAFNQKALAENVNTWWDEEDFPSTNSWAAYVEDLVNDDVISEFLPIAPDYPNADPENFFEYAYDSDSDVFVNPTGSACFDHTETFTGNWSAWNNLAGVNIVIYPGLHPDDRQFRKTFEYLDAAIDNSDGPYCGKMRHDAFNEGHSSNDRRRHHYFRYGIDFDLRPNF